MACRHGRRQGLAEAKARRKARGMALAALLATVLSAGCPRTTPDPGGASAASGPTGSPGAALPDEGTPARGGRLTVGIVGEPQGFFPGASFFDLNAYLVGSAMLEGLTVFGPDGKVEPYLAESITPSDLATTWTLKVRPGITFHDGTPCDAEAVARNLDAYRKGIPAVVMSTIDSVEVTAGDTVVVRMKQPWASFPALLASQLGMMVSVRSITGDPADAARNPVGTGPFKLERWIQGDRLTATRNANYWQEGKPYLDAIEFRSIPDPRSMANALLAGDLDLIETKDSGIVAELSGTDGYRVVTDQSGDVDHVTLNAGAPPFDNVNARKAIVLATDQRRLIDQVGNGITVGADQPLAEKSPFHTGDANYPAYDLDAARRAVSQYTAETGQPLRFRYTTVSDTSSLATAQILQSMWKEAGAEADIVTLEQTAYVQKSATGQFEAVEQVNFGYADPDWNYMFWHSSFVGGAAGELSINMAHVRDADLDSALLTGRTDLIPSRRIEAYQKVARRLNETYSYVWLYRVPWTLVGRDGVKGLNAPARTGFARTDVKPWIGELWIQR